MEKITGKWIALTCPLLRLMPGRNRRHKQDNDAGIFGTTCDQIIAVDV
jgi:hypothetical protein